MKGYLQGMPLGTVILWCYIIWYLVMVGFYFDPDISMWANSTGLCLIVGLALVLATGPLTVTRIRQQFWQVARLFLCPFCVSSFSALTKDKGFTLLVSPVFNENMVALSLCLLFCGLIGTAKALKLNTA